MLTSLISWLIYGYIRLVYLTSRWQIVGFTELKEKLQKGEPVILAFWHGRIAMMPNFAQKPQNVFVMVSRHRDGELIAQTISHFDLQLIRGSTNRAKTAAKGAKNRGGTGALLGALSTLENGKTLCVTPDGPKGPRMRVASAIAEVASLSGAAVYPVSFSTTFGKVFNSWDRFLFPFPFGRAVFVCGTPIKVQKNLKGRELKKARKAIENRLNNVTKKADELVGRTPIKPAPSSAKTAKTA